MIFFQSARVNLPVFLILQAAAIATLSCSSATWAAPQNDFTREPKGKPYGRCELLFIKGVDGARHLLARIAMEIDRYVTPVKPWDLSPEDESEIRQTLSDLNLPEAQRFERAYELLLQARIKSLNPVSQYFIRKGIANSLKKDSLYNKTLGRQILRKFGPHYNPVFNRVSTYIKSSTGLTLTDLIIRVHETEHLVQRNSNPISWMAALYVATIENLSVIFRTPFSVPFWRQQEVRALGAQWELARLIPPEIRAQLLREWRYEKSHISHLERLWVRALIKSGILDRLVDLMVRGLQLEKVGIHNEASRRALEISLVTKIVVGEGEGIDWFPTFAARAKNLLQEEDLSYIEGIAKQGSDYEPLRTELDQYLAEHSESDILSDDGLDQKRVGQLQKVVSELRYPSEISDTLDRIYGGTLEHAGLSKAEFIERLSVVHGYTLENIYYAHYASNLRTLLFYFSWYPITILAMDHFPEPPFWIILTKDIQLLVRVLSDFF